MINLLPQAEKKQIRAGRSNVLLVRYNILMLLITGMLFASIGVTSYFLSTTEQAATAKIAENATKETEYSDVKKQSKEFQAQLSEAKSVLSSDVSYSKAILAIAKLIPSGAVLTDITLDQTSFSKPLLLHAEVKNEQAALNLRNAFQNSPNFSSVSFGQVTKNTDSKYPYSIDLNVTMTKEVLQ